MLRDSAKGCRGESRGREKERTQHGSAHCIIIITTHGDVWPLLVNTVMQRRESRTSWKPEASRRKEVGDGQTCAGRLVRCFFCFLPACGDTEIACKVLIVSLDGADLHLSIRIPLSVPGMWARMHTDT